MEEAPVTAASGALGPVITKLAALLGSEYKLRWRTRRDVKFIRSKLKPVLSILWNIWEREELDEASNKLKIEALDLADDVDDAIVDFILSLERSRNNNRVVQTKIKASPFHDFKKRASDVSGRCRSNWKEKKPFSCPAKPRAYPFVRRDVSQLVGMVQPRDKLIRHLVGKEELRLKTALILGKAGMGKTTLADLVYEEIKNKFQSRTFVSVTPGGNMREVLARIHQQLQVADDISVPLAGTEEASEEHLIDIISNFLKDKRYLVIIDDIWNWREWEVIMKSLPENNLGSRIMGTTRTKAVAEKFGLFGAVPNALLHHVPNALIHELSYEDQIAMEMIHMKLVAEGFNYKHPIVSMCDGMPLAVHCMFSAVAQEWEKQTQQGIHPKVCDVQDKIEKHVKENGIQNTPGFEALVESLQLCYDDLPHHMLKTCLLYCSLYPDDHSFEIHGLTMQWISEGFVCKEEGKGYFIELENRGLFWRPLHSDNPIRMHPMMRNFLGWKSRQDNFITCSSEFTPSDNNTYRMRRLCIDNLPCRSRDAAAAADPLSALDWYHIRSLVVCEGIERVPLEKLEGLRVLVLCETERLLDHHLKDICGLVRLRHLLGLNAARLPGYIEKLQQLKTLEVRGTTIRKLPSEIGALLQLEILTIRGTRIRELPKEIEGLQHLEHLDITGTKITVLPKEIGELRQLKTLDITDTKIAVLPKEIGELRQLKTLDITRTEITVLPKEIGKLQHLEQLLMFGTMMAKIPKEVGGLNELKRLELTESITVLPLEACTLVALPECINQALKKSGLLSELAGEMLSFKKASETLYSSATEVEGGSSRGRQTDAHPAVDQRALQ